MNNDLENKFKVAATVVKNHSKVHLVSHYDADGIASLAIMAISMCRLGIDYEYTVFPTLDSKQIDTIRNLDFDCMIMTDMGSEHLADLEELGKDCIIIDHHETILDDSIEKVIHINCHDHSINGSSEASASTLAYLFSQYLGSNSDLIGLSIAGMIGDKEHIGGFKGLNKELIESATEDSRILMYNRSVLALGDVSESVFESIEPYYVGLSGYEKGVKSLLSEMAIPEHSDVITINDDKKKMLDNRLIDVLKKQGVLQSIIEDCCQYRYYIPGYDVDAERLSKIIDACGRTRHEKEGLEYCINQHSAEAEAIYLDYINRLQRKVWHLYNEGTVELENIQYFITDKSGVMGTVCGIYSRYIGDPILPVVGINVKFDRVTVASRCSALAVADGVNLSEAVNIACRQTGGSGGGHINAAGGTIDSGKEMAFLRCLDKVVGEQKRIFSDSARGCRRYENDDHSSHNACENSIGEVIQ